MHKSFKFENFEPSSDLKDLAQSTLKNIKAMAPSGSSIEIVVEKTRNGFEGFLNVNSFQGKFWDKMSNSSELDLILELANSVNKQISNWKLSRFNPTTSKEVHV